MAGFDAQQAGFRLLSDAGFSGEVYEAFAAFRPTSRPAVIAEITAATGRTIAMTGPSIAYVTEIESTPVSGVDTRKETVEDFDAPARRRPSAAATSAAQADALRQRLLRVQTDR